MLFLAVKLGFFAENITENISNREKEHQYIKSLINDLKNDTAEISRELVAQAIVIKKIDSAINIYPEEIKEVAKQDSFYHYFIYFYCWADYFTRNDNTIQQLRNAGGFNLITKSGVIDSIDANISFYNNDVKDDNDYYIECYKKVVDLGAQLMKLPKPPIVKTDPVFYSFPSNVPIFNQYTDAQLEYFYTWIKGEEGALNLCMKKEVGYGNECVRLIHFLNKKSN